MKAKELKHFFAKFGNKVRVHTGTGKGQWIGVWVPSQGGHTLTYDQPAFPLELRIACLKIIYPNSPSCWTGNAGNVSGYSITMRLPEWILLFNTYQQPA